MTIREHFQRFHKRVTYITVITVVLVVVLVGQMYPQITRLQGLMVSFIMGIPVAIVLILVFKGRFKCPRCGADFQKLRRAERRLSKFDARMFWELWDACPNCKANFDAPYSTNADR